MDRKHNREGNATNRDEDRQPPRLEVPQFRTEEDGTFEGSGGIDLIDAAGGVDVVTRTDARANIVPGGGGDVIRANGRQAIVFGGTGSDRPIGGEGTDTLGGPAIRSQLFSRNLAILLFAQGMSITGWFAVVTAGGILGRSLAANPALATLPVSLLIVGTAVSAIVASWTMARVGRARGFAIGAAVGAFGAACAFVATLTHNFALLCGASVTIGCAAAFSQQYRFAATECVGAAAAPVAISIVALGLHHWRFPRPGTDGVG